MFENKNPIEKITSDSGYCGIFRTIGCIGDSLSSGEHESRKNGENGYHDYFEYSWGQFLGRMIGSTVYNFSCGGMTAEGIVKHQDWDCLNLCAEGRACQAYTVALGVNDLNRVRNENDPYTFGSIDDVHPEDPEQNAISFAGHMGMVLSHIKRVQPKARIFLITLPRGSADEVNEMADRHRQLMYELAEKFDFTYVIDLRRFAPIYDEEFRRIHYVGFHMNALGYLFTAKMIMNYIDAIIREKPEDFAQVAFIGRENDLHNENYVW